MGGPPLPGDPRGMPRRGEKDRESQRGPKRQSLSSSPLDWSGINTYRWRGRGVHGWRTAAGWLEPPPLRWVALNCAVLCCAVLYRVVLWCSAVWCVGVCACVCASVHVCVPSFRLFNTDTPTRSSTITPTVTGAAHFGCSQKNVWVFSLLMGNF